MRKKRKLILKYLLLISVLMLMMLLCACRVRLTNNTEVASTITDEDGWLTDSYQMRRDQLGEPVAERPIFKGFESGDDEEDYSDVDYEPLDYDQGTMDEWEEPEDTSSNTPSSSTNRNSSGGGSGSSSGSSSESSEDEEEKKPEEPKPDPVIEIIVEFDANGGYVKETYRKVVFGSTYGQNGALPIPTRDDKDLFFSGWFTDAKEGSLITAESTVESEEPLKLYAHWGKNYPFVLKLDGGKINEESDDIPMKSDKGLYPTLPDPKKTGFHFMGWYLPDGTTKVETGQECISDQPLKAHWLENAKYWEKVYNDTNPADENKVLFITDDINTTGKLVRGTPWDASTSPDSSPAFVIIKLADGTYSPDAAKNAAAQKRAENEKYADSKIIVIPKNATDGSNELYYKLVLHNAMYGGIEGIDTAAAETGAAISDYAVDPDKAAPAQ